MKLPTLYCLHVTDSTFCAESFEGRRYLLEGFFTPIVHMYLKYKSNALMCRVEGILMDEFQMKEFPP